MRQMGTYSLLQHTMVECECFASLRRKLRELAAAKNLAFRESLLGRELTAVTIEPLGLALTDNYVKAQLDLPYAPNRLIRLRPRTLNAQGVMATIIGEA